VTRVPKTISEAETRIQEAGIESMEPLKEGYRAEECRSKYGDTEQRWLVVHSEEAEERAQERVEDQVQREHEKEAKAFSELEEWKFACREDAGQALEEFEPIFDTPLSEVAKLGKTPADCACRCSISCNFLALGVSSRWPN